MARDLASSDAATLFACCRVTRDSTFPSVVVYDWARFIFRFCCSVSARRAAAAWRFISLSFGKFMVKRLVLSYILPGDISVRASFPCQMQGKRRLQVVLMGK